eukprot:TRINITY_DN7458_c1_g2_i2.p2 TRINITY_DN7458_c1_g2~~TRINITY_DN7458_c1_g2_i2.p2  ORF type:complete len:142 (+),score=37.78 TRINITY_DN7458_c1_g2_i2:68-493(+)
MAQTQTMEAQSLPFVGERPNKKLQVRGMSDAASAGQARHPVERLLLDAGRRSEQQEMMTKAVVYGQHAPLRAKMERELLSQFQRLPGLPSSFIGLETVLGMEDKIEFEDVFNLEAHAPTSKTVGPNWGLHDAMEARLNMRF